MSEDLYFTKFDENNFEEVFFENLKFTKKSLFLSAPYIKEEVAEKISTYISSKIKVKYFLTNFSLENYIFSSDIEALKILKKNGFQIFNQNSLHAKFFIFDQNLILGSANLTKGGFKKNIETSLLVKDSKVLDKLKKLFDENLLVSSQDIEDMELEVKKYQKEKLEIKKLREKIKKSEISKEGVFHLYENDKKIASGKYVENKKYFLVFAGAKIKYPNYTEKMLKYAYIQKYKKDFIKLEKEKKIEKETDSIFKLTENHQFSSPSSAASIILSQSTNGLRKWRKIDKKGRFVFLEKIQT